jgi:hypothetical protein
MQEPGVAGEGKMRSKACWIALKQHQWRRKELRFIVRTMWGIQREMSRIGESG